MVPDDEKKRARVREVEEASLRLPEKQRRVILLKYVHGLSLAEIAEVEECPEGTVKSRLHHGIKALRRRLNPPSFEKIDCA